MEILGNCDYFYYYSLVTLSPSWQTHMYVLDYHNLKILIAIQYIKSKQDKGASAYTGEAPTREM